MISQKTFARGLILLLSKMFFILCSTLISLTVSLFHPDVVKLAYYDLYLCLYPLSPLHLYHCLFHYLYSLAITMIKPRLPEDCLGGLIDRMCLRKYGLSQIHKDLNGDRLWR